MSYLDHQGGKILDRFDPDTYSVLVRVMDGHDVGRDRGGIVEAFRALAAAGTGLTGIGIEGDILYGPDQVRLVVGEAAAAGVDAAYRRDRDHQGPRRLPDRVGPAHAAAGRRAGRWAGEGGRGALEPVVTAVAAAG